MLPFTVHPVGDCALLASFHAAHCAGDRRGGGGAEQPRSGGQACSGVDRDRARLCVAAGGVRSALVTDYDARWRPPCKGWPMSLTARTARGGGGEAGHDPCLLRRRVSAPTCPLWPGTRGGPKQEVIALHTGRDYRIYMLGFLPGFPYLGGLDERLFTPRLGTPRTAIPAGAVGIGGEQTGIYPIASPGGWQLIGRTPRKLFDPACGRAALRGGGPHPV